MDNGTTKTWKFKLAVHNLFNYPDRQHRWCGGAVGHDRHVRVLLERCRRWFRLRGVVVLITISATQGQASLHVAEPARTIGIRIGSRRRGSRGTARLTIRRWTFTAPSRVTSFRFALLLSTPWPRGLQAQDTTWKTFYNPVSDSFPDTNAKPPWKTIGVRFGGTYSLSGGTLLMDVNHS